MSWFVVDVETDGKAPGLFSMVSFAAVRLDATLQRTFYAETRPISSRYDPEALAVSKFTRAQHESFEDPALVMPRFFDWVQQNTVGPAKLVSDNPAFDAAFINYYFIAYCQDNPFGHSARRIGDLYCGLVKNARAGGRWRELGTTPHTHHPLDDARRAAEALRAMALKYGLKGVDWSGEPPAA